MIKILKQIFWDTNLKQINIKKNSPYVIGRILEYGDLSQINWMFRQYSSSQIKKILISTRNLTPKSANFWADYYGISKRKIGCLNRQLQKTQKILWPY
jgi:hypothetical protein